MKIVMHRLLTAALTLWLLLPLASQAADNFPAKQTFAGQALSLNGKGVRTKLVFNLYTAGLYVTAPSKDANALLDAKQALALRMEITSSMITSENMEEAVREGFQKSAGANLTALQAKIESLIQVFKQPIKEGDVYDFVYKPQSTVIIKNGRNAATIAGVDFKQALFGIWIGAKPVQANLKSALLGG